MAIETTWAEKRFAVTVGAVVSEYVRRFSPDSLVFGGKSNEPSRIKLYDRIVSRFMSLPAFRSYVNITNDNFEWPEELESEIDDIQSIENQKLYVLVHNRYFKEFPRLICGFIF